MVAEKRVWSGSHTHLVLAPRKVTIEHVIVAQVYGRVRLLFGQFVDVAYISTACISDFPLPVGRITKVSFPAIKLSTA